MQHSNAIITLSLYSNRFNQKISLFKHMETHQWNGGISGQHLDVHSTLMPRRSSSTETRNRNSPMMMRKGLNGHLFDSGSMGRSSSHILPQLLDEDEDEDEYDANMVNGSDEPEHEKTTPGFVCYMCPELNFNESDQLESHLVNHQ